MLKGFPKRIRHDVGEIFRENSKKFTGLGLNYPQSAFAPAAAPFGEACQRGQRQPTGPLPAPRSTNHCAGADDRGDGFESPEGSPACFVFSIGISPTTIALPFPVPVRAAAGTVSPFRPFREFAPSPRQSRLRRCRRGGRVYNLQGNINTANNDEEFPD